MSVTPREIGTLIVVVLRANHLPNKRHIGKQDPYCTVTVNGERRRTKAIKRGGQHPDWDEEIRFTIFEDNDDILARTAKGDGTPPPPPKDENKIRNIKGGKTMKLACYADDSREPDLIGECNVDLTEVLTKGETDDWFTLMNKDKFAGKVYLELTFWSNEPAPEKKPKQKMTKNSNQYAGPGSFIPAGNHSNSPSESHSRQASDVLPSHMRISNHANLYVAPYENNWNSQVDGLTQELGDFRIPSQARRRESFPPVVGAYSQTPYGSGHSTITPYHAHGYDQSLPGSVNPYPYERPVTPGQSTIHFPHSTSGPVQYSSYQPTFDAAPTYHVPSRGPRHSIATSSGFMPLPQVSGFLPSHASEPSGFIPPVSHTPAPVGFTPQFPTQSQNVYSSPMSPTPAPSQHTPYLSHSASLSFHPQQSHPSSPSSYNYSSYNIPASASAPPQQFISSPLPQPNYPPPANTAPPQMYPSSPHEVAQSPSMYPNGNMSRPLPQQPQVIYTQMQQHPPIPPSQSLPELPPPPPLDPRQTNYPATNGYSEIPPPPAPPAPALQYKNDVSLTRSGLQLVVPPPPPPPPLSSINGVPRGRRTSLPAPPVSYQQPAYPQSQPAPASLDMYSHIPPPPPPPALNSTLDRGLPKPPIPVNEHGQWIQPANAYSSQGY